MLKCINRIDRINILPFLLEQALHEPLVFCARSTVWEDDAELNAKDDEMRRRFAAAAAVGMIRSREKECVRERERTGGRKFETQVLNISI